MRVAGLSSKANWAESSSAWGERTDQVPQEFPGATLGGGQQWMVIARYPTADGPKLLYDHPKYQAVKELRDLGTKNYVWAYYREADVLTES